MKSAVTLKTVTVKGIKYWVARWVDFATGKNKAKSLGRVDTVSKRSASKAAQALEIDFDNNPANRSMGDKITLAEYLAAFVANKRAEGKEPKTVNEYELVGKLLTAAIDPQRPLGEVSYRDAQRFATSLRNGELESAKGERKGPKGKVFKGRATGSSTASKYIAKARTIFKSARIQHPEQVRLNPFEGVKAGKVGAKQWHPVTLDEFEKVFAGAPENWRYIFAVARLASLSLADVRRLKWSNVDMAKKVIRYKRKKTGIYGEPPIVPRLHEILTELKASQGLKIHSEEYVVPRPLPGNITRDWTRTAKEGHKLTRDGIAAKCGVMAWNDPFHSCRKSCISDWANAGVPAHVLKTWAAHASVVTTLTYYTHVATDHLEAAIKGTLGNGKKQAAG